MLYYKIIAGEIVIHDDKTLKTEDGRCISDPTPETFEADGWLPYNPPPFVPKPQDEPTYHMIAEAVKKIFSTDTEEMSDEDALEVAALFPTWSSKLNKEDPSMPGEQVTAGERLWDDGKLWKVLNTHNVQVDWRPADAVSLFVEVSIEEWPEWRQPLGAQDAYRLGAQVSHNDLHWISEIDYNTYEPGVYGWRQP